LAGTTVPSQHLNLFTVLGCAWRRHQDPAGASPLGSGRLVPSGDCTC